ncbi:hypothetical protein HUT11_35700 (plasmid) [Streptomyces seoulensis]|nr:hypothetical protein HUT11_35700 [Streptomyces seoulensis]
METALAQATRTDNPAPTAFRDPTPIPTIGPTPPVPQPGRPPMSSKATDDSVRMLSAGFLTLCGGGAISSILWASGHADPTTIGVMAAAPAGLAIPILALSRLVKRAKNVVAAAPPVVHNHYDGIVHVDARTVNSQTRGVWASTRNQLPRGSQ